MNAKYSEIELKRKEKNHRYDERIKCFFFVMHVNDWLRFVVQQNVRRQKKEFNSFFSYRNLFEIKNFDVDFFRTIKTRRTKKIE